MDVLLAFAAALVTLRLAAELIRKWRVRRAPELLAWAASLAAFAAASARSPGRRGGLGRSCVPGLLPLRRLTAALLGRVAPARRCPVAGPVALVYAGPRSASRSRCRSIPP